MEHTKGHASHEALLNWLYFGRSVGVLKLAGFLSLFFFCFFFLFYLFFLFLLLLLYAEADQRAHHCLYDPIAGLA